jgi:hypothetical protein
MRSQSHQHEARIVAEIILNIEDKYNQIKNVNSHSIDYAFAEEALEFHYFLLKQIELFNQKTGHNLPEAKITLGRTYKNKSKVLTIDFASAEMQPHVLSAFYMFLNSQISLDLL